MALTREERLTLGGLVTQPNKYLAEPGSLARADNTMSRKPQTIEPRIAFQNLADPGAGVGDVIPRSITCRQALDSLIVSFGPTATPETRLTETALTVGAIVVPVKQEDGTDFVTRGAVGEARNRVFLDSLNADGLFGAVSPQLVRAIDPDDLSLARRAGMIPPSWLDIASGGDGVAVLDTKWVGYRAHFERKHADGYIQIGPVSPLVLFQAAADVRTDLTIYWSRITDGNDWIRVGDLLRVYRTDNAANKDEVGDTLRLAGTVELDSSDLSAFSATFTDVTADEGLEDFLYTNSGQGSSDESKWFPPSASDIVTFRNVNWYASPFALRVFQLRVPGKWGDFASAADGRGQGVGSFVLSTTTTSGNASFSVSAPNAVGLAIGQVVIEDGSGAFVPGTARITNIVGTTITMSAVAAASGPTTFRVGDRIEINGEQYPAYSPARLMRAIAQATIADELNYPCWVFASAPLVWNPSSLVDTAVEGVTLTFVAPSFSTNATFTASGTAVRATNGSKWSPVLPGLSSSPAAVLGTDDMRLNRGFFSEIEEPEAVPVLNYRFFGKGALLKFTAVEDAMLAWCTDGTYVCTGDGENWEIREFDLALHLLHRNAVDVMNGTIWALTDRGLVAISGRTVEEISTPFIGDLIRQLEVQFKTSFQPVGSLGDYNISLRCDPYHKEVWIRWRLDAGTGVTLVWNLETKTWHKVLNTTEIPTALAYNKARRSMIIGSKRITGIQTLRESYPDSSVSPAERMPSAAFELNPYAGPGLNTRKEWIEAVYDLEFLDASDDLTIQPFFGSTSYPAPYTVNVVAAGDVEHVVKVPRNASKGKQLSPGLTVTGTAAADTAAPWRLSGVTVKFRVSSPDTRRQ